MSFCHRIVNWATAATIETRRKREKDYFEVLACSFGQWQGYKHKSEVQIKTIETDIFLLVDQVAAEIFVK